MRVYAWEEPGGKLRAAGILDGDGLPLGMDRTSTVAMNSFMAAGGDGYVIGDWPPLHDYGDAATGLIKYLRSRPHPDFEALRADDCLFLFPSREEAEKAWREAVGDAEVRTAA
jgi:2',3'-cyclic-nucleotide 2'-phosphodiesterase (5'-nucleotidase family)